MRRQNKKTDELQKRDRGNDESEVQELRRNLKKAEEKLVRKNTEIAEQIRNLKKAREDFVRKVTETVGEAVLWKEKCKANEAECNLLRGANSKFEGSMRKAREREDKQRTQIKKM